MASGGKRKGGGERVLEGRHVIGLFLLMLLFSGVFFTLGYVMGRNQYDGQVRAATTSGSSTGIAAFRGDSSLSPKHTTNKVQTPAPDSSTDNSTSGNSDWEFYKAGEPNKTEDHLEHLAPVTPAAPVPAASSNPAPVLVKSPAPPPKTNLAPAKPIVGPTIPVGAYILQVAALNKEADAMDLAMRLQKKKFPAFVLSPKGDKYYRVQVGPYADQKSADAARKGLDAAGFKAIVKH